MLTKAKLAEYNQRGELVPIGTKLITVQLGECEIYAHNKGRGNNYIYECYNSQRRMSYDKEFKLTIDNAYTSLIDPTPSSVNSPFTRDELEHARPIQKEKTLADLKEGDKVYAVGQYVMINGSRKGFNILDFGKLHDVTSVNGNSFAIRTIEAEFHWFHSDRDKHIFSCYPPTPEQIATAEAAEIQAVKDKYELMKKEVTQ
jgi:hypothetical protein